MSQTWQRITFSKYKLIDRGLIALCSISIPAQFNICPQLVLLKSKIKESSPIFMILMTKEVKHPWLSCMDLFEDMDIFLMADRLDRCRSHAKVTNVKL